MGGAWVLLGNLAVAHGSRMDAAAASFREVHFQLAWFPALCPWDAKERLVLDLLYIGLTIVVFAALWLLIRGVERFER
jgi:hypothetical protein